MPILQRRPAILGSRHTMSARNSTESDETLKEQIVIVEDDYEKPQKEMDFPSAKLGSMSSYGRSKNNLRINTYSKTKLHDRYLSSEEEPSPSADEHESHEEELRHKPSVRLNEEASTLMADTESRAEIAIAVPILSLGRPKLVDITNLAPIHKRKQRIPKSQVPHTAFKFPAVRIPTVVDENTPFPANEAAEVVTSPASITSTHAPKRKESRPILTAPDTWLPSEGPPSDDEYNVPELDIRRTPSYHDYDPYSLEPPRLVSSARPSRVRGSSGSGSIHANTSSWKGLTRSLSMAKKHNSHQQVAKKPKMVARGANEREDMLVLPPFPFESGITA